MKAPCARLRTAFPGAALAVAGALLVFAAGGCSELRQDLAEDIKQSYGLDTDDPVQVGVAAMGARVLGDDEKADGLEVFQGLRRAEHEERGDRLSFVPGGSPDDKLHTNEQARDEYEKALAWAPDGTDRQKLRITHLHDSIAATHHSDALAQVRLADQRREAGRPEDAKKAEDQARSSYRKAGGAFMQAAEVGPHPEHKGSNYWHAGWFSHQAGDQTAACHRWSLAQAADPSYRIPPLWAKAC